MQSFGQPRLIFNYCNPFHYWPLPLLKNFTTILYCNSESEEDTNTTKNNSRANCDSHEFDQMTRAWYSILCMNFVYHFNDFKSFIFID